MNAAPDPPLIIALLGYRASGKTQVGQHLAERLGWPFHDTDRMIEQSTGRTVREIFSFEGEAHFRDREALALVTALDHEPAVVSVGGGGILREENRRLLRVTARCVWLTAAPSELRRRLQADAQTTDLRPSLTGRGALEEIEEVLAQREPLYRVAADRIVATDGRTVAQVADELWQWVRDGAPAAEHES